MAIPKSWYPYLLLPFFPFVLFAPIILSGQALFWGTPLTQFIPWWTTAWEMVIQGIIPLWSSSNGMGAPLIANYQSALFYPPTWIYFILYLIAGVPAMAWGQALVVVFHLSWAAIGMALLIRQLGVSKFGQIVGGLAFGLSSYLVSRAGFLSINATVAWMPWIILAITRLVESLSGTIFIRDSIKPTQPKNKRIDQFAAFLLLVFCVAMQLLSGHAQITWYTMVLGALWVIFLGSLLISFQMSNGKVKHFNQDSIKKLSGKLVGIKPYDQLNFKPVILITVVFGVALIIAIGLAAIQLFPTAEYLIQSQRSAEVDYEYAVSYSLWPWRLLTLFAPGLYGSPVSGDYWGYANYWEDAIYIGIIPLVFALITLFSRGGNTSMRESIKPAFARFSIVIILVSFLIALGRNIPLYPWLYENIPTFDMFQAPTRISILAVFSLTLLSAFGVDSWKRPGPRGMYWLRLGVVAALAISIGAISAWFTSQSLAWEIKPSFIKAAAILGIWVTGLVILAIIAPASNKESGLKRKLGRWEWAVILVVGADLILAGWGLNPAVDLNVYADPSPTAAEISGTLNGGRLYLPNEDEYQLKFDRFLRFDTFQPFDFGDDWSSLRAVMLPNVTQLDGISSANNFDPLLPGRYENWLETLQNADHETFNLMLDLMGVTVIERIDSGSINGVKFESRAANPRFMWISCSVQADSGEKALEMIKNNEIDPHSEVIIEQVSLKEGNFCFPASKANLKILSQQNNRIEIRVSASSPGYLVMADVWYPGWRAWKDGEEIPILHANYLFRAMAVPAGDYSVVIAYRPMVFYLGALISGTFIAGILVFGFFWISKLRTGGYTQE